MAECACPKGGTGLPTSYAPVISAVVLRKYLPLFMENL
jgi:hypothetical protein